MRKRQLPLDRRPGGVSAHHAGHDLAVAARHHLAQLEGQPVEQLGERRQQPLRHPRRPAVDAGQRVSRQLRLGPLEFGGQDAQQRTRVVARPSPYVRRLFELTAIDQSLDIVDDVV